MRKILLLLLLCSVHFGFSQSGVKINSPQNGEELFPGDVLIFVTIDPALPFAKVQFFLDARNITPQFRKVPGAATCLLRQPLIPGNHFLRVSLQTDTGTTILTESTFKIVRLQASEEPDKPPVKSDKKKFFGDVFALTGNIIAETRQTSLEGSGRQLRQEPVQTNFLFMNTALVNKNFKVPLRMTLATDESTFQPNVQSRNFFQTGIQTRHFEVLVGDLNPSLDRLLFTGTRVRGLQATINFPRFKAIFLYGDLNRSLEGKKQLYRSDQGLAPSNMADDSTFITPGVYRREVWALRLEIGNTQLRNSKTGITFLKAKDDTSSIRFGQDPKDNIGANIDHLRFFWKKRIRIGLGFSAALTTLNTNLGIERKSRLDSILDRNFPFEPKDVSRLLIINVSTTNLSQAVYAGYGNLSLKVLRQDLFFEFTRIGSAYQSLANPFMRNDQQQFLFTDRFDLFKRKLFVNLRYFNLINNLTDNQLATVINHTASASLTYSPGVGRPQFFSNLMFQNRLSSGNKLSITGATNDQIINFSAGSSWNFKSLGIDHFISIQYNYTTRNDLIKTGNDNAFNSWGVILNQKFRFPIVIEFNYNASNNRFSSLAANNNKTNAWFGMLGYEFKKIKLTGSLGAGQNNMLIGDRIQDTQRQQYFMRFSFKGIKGIQFDVEGGLSPFRDQIILSNQYDEKYFFARLTYNLNGRNLATW